MDTKPSKGKEIKIPGPDHPVAIFPVEGKVRVTVFQASSRIVTSAAVKLYGS